MMIIFLAISGFSLFSNIPSQIIETENMLNLAPNPSFEDITQGTNGWYPTGIVVDAKEPLTIADGIYHTGTHSMKVDVGPVGETKGTLYYSSYNGGEGKREISGSNGVGGARTIAYRMDRNIRAFKASVWIKTESEKDICLSVKWYSRNGRRRPVELTHTDSSFHLTESSDGWSKYEIEAIRPHDTHQAQLWIETMSNSPFYVDDVHIVLLRSESIQILVDQLGYEPESKTKEILLQSSTQLKDMSPTFNVIDFNSLDVAFVGNWVELGYHESFDRYYWNGDLSRLQKTGTYVIEAKCGIDMITSVPFEITQDLTDQVSKLAYEFFYYQRCGMEIPGFHKACHLDDAKMPDGSHLDLVGGWHDAGDYNKYNAGFTPESLYILALTYSRKKEFFDQFDRDKDGICDILDEAIWGAKYLHKCLDSEKRQLIANISSGYRYWGTPETETDNIPNSDDRPVTGGYVGTSFIVGGFAIAGQYSDRHYISLAEEIYRNNGGSIPDLIALYKATENQDYMADLKAKIKELVSSSDKGLSQFRNLAEYILAFPNADEAKDIEKLARTKYEEILSMCDKYFGVRQYIDSSGQKHYFRKYGHINDWYVGDSSEILDLAYTAIMLYRLGIAEAKQIAEEQLHWIFGHNPFDSSLMEGVGKRFVPCYHHRYNTIPGNWRGAVPGTVINGITRAFPWIDRPWLDLNPIPTGEFQCNEPWLPHNIRMLYVMSLW